MTKLEGLRGLAAFYFFLGHLWLVRVGDKGSVVGLTFRFGQEAVMLFFLLSGFVIFYAFSRAREQSFGNYFGKRFRRIYPIFLLALLSAYLGQVANTGAWTVDWRTLGGNVLMLQDFANGKPGGYVRGESAAVVAFV